MYRGDRAKVLLEDPMVQEALNAMKVSVREQMFTLPIEAREQRDFLFLMDKARQQFERCFEVLIQGAQIHRAEIAQEAQMQSRLDGLREQTRNR